MAYTLPSYLAANFTVQHEPYPEVFNGLKFVFPAGSYTAQGGTSVNFVIPTSPTQLTDFAVPPRNSVNFTEAAAASSTLYPSGSNASEFGTADVQSLVSKILCGGIPSQLAFGTADVQNLVSKILCGGIPSKLAFGNSSIAWPQFVKNAGGRDAVVFGSGTTATHYRRYLDTDGLNHAVFGTLWASRSPREVSPAGISNIALPNPIIGYRRTASPEGIVATYFGTANIHDNTQNLYCLGFSNAYGTPTVKNWLTYVEVYGFRTVLNDVRVGTPIPYNLTQYVEQVWSVDDLYSGGWFGEQEIVNRNRHLFPFGQVLTRPGYPDIYNSARVLEPTGAVPQDPPEYYKAGYITHRIQPVTPEGMDPPHITGWHVLYNGARVIAPSGFVATTFGDVLSEDRSVYHAGNWDSSAFGTAFAAPRVRTLTQLWPLDPPMMTDPVVRQWRNYIEPLGFTPSGAGVPWVEIHWNLITPRWTQRDFFGTPVVQNLTPEVGAYGHDSFEAGVLEIRTQWRNVRPSGANTAIIGYAKIADRRQWIENVTIPVSGFGNTVCYRIGNDPPSNRKILVGSIAEDEYQQNDKTKPLKVPAPVVWQMIIYVLTPDPYTKFGSATVTSNVIDLIYNGIASPAYANKMTGPLITLGNRIIYPDGCEKAEYNSYGKPRISPHTVYAVKEAPPQAVINHPLDQGHVLHYVDQQSGKGLGTPAITNSQRVIYCTDTPVKGVYPNNFLRVSTPVIDNSVRYIVPIGFLVKKVGGHTIDNGVRTITATGFTGWTTGSTTIRHVGLPEPVYAESITGFAFGATDIQNQHRSFTAGGLFSERFGVSSSSDLRYMPQHLIIKQVDNPAIQGFDACLFGDSWPSFRVRDIGAKGFDANIYGYEAGFFNDRMRVTRTTLPVAEPDSVNQYDSTVHEIFGRPAIGNLRQVIVPDGNAETFRQGGYQ